MQDKIIRIRMDSDLYDTLKSDAKKETNGNLSGFLKKIIKAYLDKKSAKKK